MYGSPDALVELTRGEASLREPECYGPSSVGGRVPSSPTRRDHTPDGFFESLHRALAPMYSLSQDRSRCNGATVAFSLCWMPSTFSLQV